ncbi:cytochrome P450 CYP82D47-like protein [Tanacetum coccineum]
MSGRSRSIHFISDWYEHGLRAVNARGDERTTYLVGSWEDLRLESDMFRHVARMRGLDRDVTVKWSGGGVVRGCLRTFLDDQRQRREEVVLTLLSDHRHDVTQAIVDEDMGGMVAVGIVVGGCDVWTVRPFKEEGETMVISFALIPFEAGGRSCRGTGLALQMLHMVLATLLQKFELSTPKLI